MALTSTSSKHLTGTATAVAIPAGIFFLTLLLRAFRLSDSYDIFVDEPFYVALGKSVAQGHLPYATGSLFFLHPPGHSLLEAGWMHVTAIQGGDAVETVFAMRYLTVAFACITSVLLYLFGCRLGGRFAGITAASLFAISPWFVRQNSFVLLETCAMAFVMAGFLALMHLPSRGTRLRLLALVGIGLAFGFGVLIKEFAVFVTVLPLAVLGWRRDARRTTDLSDPEPLRRWPIARAEAVMVIAVTCVPYVLWCVIVALTGNLSEFWNQTSSGLSRAAGSSQTTGFNSPGAPSFVSTIMSNVTQFWTTYLTLAFGSIAILRLFLSPDRAMRLLGAFGIGAMPLLAYSATLGANEEQFYYYLLIPAALALGVAANAAWRAGGRLIRRTLLVVAIVWAASDMTNWVVLHTGQDNGVQQMDQWMREHVAEGTTIGVTNSVQRDFLERYNMVDDVSIGALDSARGARYLVVFDRQVQQGYAFIGPDDLAEQVRHRPRVFSTYGRSNGEIDVYSLD